MTFRDDFALYFSWSVAGVCMVITAVICGLAVQDLYRNMQDTSPRRQYTTMQLFPAFFGMMAFLTIVSWREEFLVEIFNTTSEVSEVFLVWAFSGVAVQCVGGRARIRYIFSKQPALFCCCKKVLGPGTETYLRYAVYHFLVVRPIYGGLALGFQLSHNEHAKKIVSGFVMLSTCLTLFPFFLLMIMSSEAEVNDEDEKLATPWVNPAYNLARKFLGFKLMILLVVIQRSIFVMAADAGYLKDRLIFSPDDRALRSYCLLIALEMPFVAMLLKRAYPPSDDALLEEDRLMRGDAEEGYRVIEDSEVQSKPTSPGNGDKESTSLLALASPLQKDTGTGSVAPATEQSTPQQFYTPASNLPQSPANPTD